MAIKRTYAKFSPPTLFHNREHGESNQIRRLMLAVCCQLLSYPYYFSYENLKVFTAAAMVDVCCAQNVLASDDSSTYNGYASLRQLNRNPLVKFIQRIITQFRSHVTEADNIKPDLRGKFQFGRSLNQFA